jgi:hypothetical protein
MSRGKKIVTWKERALEKAKRRVANRPSLGDSSIISIKGGVFTFNGAPMSEEIDVIVLDECLENSYYTKPFDEVEFQVPECWALSEPLSVAENELGEGMAPHEKASNPQSSECAGCQWNSFGTSQFGSGRGKACGNRTRLLVLAADDLEHINRAMVAIMKIPPTGTKVWNAHTNWLYRIEEVSPEYAITRVSLKKLRPTDMAAVPFFEHIGVLPDDLAEQVDTMIERNQHVLLQPFPDGTATSTTTKKRAVKKKAARR